MDGYAIIPALPGHLEHLQAIERAAAGLFPPGVLPDRHGDDVLPLATFREAADRGELWVATTAGSGVPVGFALLGEAGGFAMLMEVDVLPAHGRKGVGKKLVERVAAEALARGRGELYLTTFRGIPWNAPFYARLGFAVVDGERLPAALAAVLEMERRAGLADRVCMRKILARRKTEPSA